MNEDLSNFITPAVEFLKNDLEIGICCARKVMGYIELSDGRRVEIQLSLESDTKEWISRKNAEKEKERLGV